MPESCPSEKVIYASVVDATFGARGVGRGVNADGKLAQDLYVYKCPDCRMRHLTRMAAFEGKPHVRVFVAPPVELQRWAMPPSATAAATRAVHQAAIEFLFADHVGGAAKAPAPQPMMEHAIAR